MEIATYLFVVIVVGFQLLVVGSETFVITWETPKQKYSLLTDNR